MADYVEIKVEIDGKKYARRMKISSSKKSGLSNENLLFRQASDGMNLIFKEISKDLLKKAIEKSKEDEWKRL
jgi:hypothetical protein